MCVFEGKYMQRGRWSSPLGSCCDQEVFIFKKNSFFFENKKLCLTILVGFVVGPIIGG